MTQVVVKSNAAHFGSALALYIAASKKAPDDVLDKKGRDLGIRLFRGFRGRQFGGPKRNSVIARRELASRTAAGVGTRIRGSLMAEYQTQRAALRSEIENFIGPRNARQELGTIKRRVALWQSFVGREIGIRQKGIGVLAASFLWFRRRSSQAKGIYYVKNRSGRRSLGSVEKVPGRLTIVAEVAAIGDVDERYGIVDRALSESATDMLQYVQRKQVENFNAAFRLLGRIAA